MSTISSKEKNIALIVIVVILYGAAALSYKPQMSALTIAKRNFQREEKKLLTERALIAARTEWNDRYETMRSRMPSFPYEKDVVTDWFRLMDTAAARAGLNILQRPKATEIEVGDVYELPVECPSWGGTLEQLVKFLYDLDQKGAMLDIRKLNIRSDSKPGFLKGSFTLNCAYMRGDAK